MKRNYIEQKRERAHCMATAKLNEMEKWTQEENKRQNGKEEKSGSNELYQEPIADKREKNSIQT